LYRKGSVAITKVFLENLKYRTRRDSDIDPWSNRDNYRMNHAPLRELVLVKTDDTDEGSMYVQYVNENTFNVFAKDEENGYMTPIILDAECHMSEDEPDHLIIRTDHHLYNVDYFMDPKENNVVTQLDYEGSPLKIKVRKTVLERETDGAVAVSDSAKSPMPGTVVKVFVKAGDEVKAGTPLASIESMKMEFVIKATHDVTIGKIDI
jgi:biotin carboxyl carrier protein